MDVLDLPEPVRSETLALFGMTAEEFRAHQAGIAAAFAERDAEVEAGLASPSAMHYDEDGENELPGVSVVKDWPKA